MEQKLVLHEAIHKPKLGDIIIEITDVQFHTNARVTNSQANTIDRSVQSNKPGRVFSPMSQGSLKTIHCCFLVHFLITNNSKFLLQNIINKEKEFLLKNQQLKYHYFLVKILLNS